MVGISQQEPGKQYRMDSPLLDTLRAAGTAVRPADCPLALGEGSI